MKNPLSSQGLWRKIERYPLGHPKAEPGFQLVDRLVEEFGWKRKFAQRAVAEFRRFFFLGVIGKSNTRVVPSSVVDDVWHVVMKFTREYAEMCNTLAGRMIHHRPAISAAEVQELSGAFEHTLERYRQLFQQEPPAEFWTAGAGSWGCSCGGGD
jgi:hypothetical protein